MLKEYISICTIPWMKRVCNSDFFPTCARYWLCAVNISNCKTSTIANKIWLTLCSFSVLSVLLLLLLVFLLVLLFCSSAACKQCSHWRIENNNLFVSIINGNSKTKVREKRYIKYTCTHTLARHTCTLHTAQGTHACIPYGNKTFIFV